MTLLHLGPTATLPDGRRNPLSHIVRAGDYVFFSGLMPKGEDGQLVDGDIGAQTRNVMARLKSMLDEAGCTFGDIVKVQVWLTDAADFPAFNDAYAAFFDGAFPARSAVRCDLLLPTAKLELEAIAYKPLS